VLQAAVLLAGGSSRAMLASARSLVYVVMVFSPGFYLIFLVIAKGLAAKIVCNMTYFSSVVLDDKLNQSVLSGKCFIQFS